MQFFWYLFEDFMEQPLIMKAFEAWGWASMLIMVLGIVFVTDWGALGGG